MQALRRWIRFFFQTVSHDSPLIVSKRVVLCKCALNLGLLIGLVLHLPQPSVFKSMLVVYRKRSHIRPFPLLSNQGRLICSWSLVIILKIKKPRGKKRKQRFWSEENRKKPRNKSGGSLHMCLLRFANPICKFGSLFSPLSVCPFPCVRARVCVTVCGMEAIVHGVL